MVLPAKGASYKKEVDMFRAFWRGHKEAQDRVGPRDSTRRQIVQVLKKEFRVIVKPWESKAIEQGSDMI